MVASHRQLQGRPLRHLTRDPAPAAIAHWILAAGFLFLAVGQLAGPLDTFPRRELIGQEIVDRWWLLEVTAIWSVPAAGLVLRIPGAGTLLVKVILPLVALTALALGACRQSTTTLCAGVVLVLLLSKCLPLARVSNSPFRRARELFATRVLVGVLAGLLAVVAAGIVLVAIRKILDPAGLHGGGAARAALLLAGVFYFASLAVLEVVMRDPRTERRLTSRGAPVIGGAWLTGDKLDPR